MKKFFTLAFILFATLTVFSQDRVLDLPFEENFSSNSLATNQWTTFGGSNWRLSATMGDPPPSVIFYGTPVNYDQTLESDFLDASSSGTESVFFAFDMAVSVINATGNEILTIEVNNGTGWQQIGEFDNGGGGMSWSTYFYDITTNVANSSFKVRFRAHGQNFADVNSWMVDNIHVFLSPVGVKDAAQSAVKLYPNPANGSQITFDLSADVRQIIIFDILGNKELSMTIAPKDKSVKADISCLSNGIYIVKFITSTGKNFARRLVVK